MDIYVHNSELFVHFLDSFILVKVKKFVLLRLSINRKSIFGKDKLHLIIFYEIENRCTCQAST